jgi:hypothetical protein
MKSAIYKVLRLELIVISLVLFAHQRLEAEVILADGMNTPGNYSGFSFNGSSSMTNPDDTSLLEPLIGNASGGNPGPWLQLTHNHNVERNLGGAPLNGNGNTSIQSIVDQQVFTFNPAISGTIQDISFSLDIDLPISLGTVGFEQLFFTVRSLSTGNAAGFTNITAQPGWQTVTVSGLTNADFSAQDFSGANALSFGFGFTSSGDVTSGAQAISIGVDNFVVTINSIPEPSSTLLVGSMLLLLVARRSRRPTA